MPKILVSSENAFREKFPLLFSAQEKGPRLNALRRYFAKRGVISVESGEDGKWPELVYPDPMRLNQLVSDATALKKNLEGKHSDWKKEYSKAKNYALVNSVKKFSHPLYWKHIRKRITDNDYRRDSKKVSLPVHLVSDPKWEPMIRMFVSDTDYRKQLAQTVEESPVYSKDKRLARNSENVQELRLELSGGKLGELNEKIQNLERDISMYSEVLRWAKEKPRA